MDNFRIFILFSCLVKSSASQNQQETQNIGRVCGQPQVPENGHVIFASSGPLAVGTRIKFKCDIGFIHLGVEESVCREDLIWSNKAPVCAVNVALYRPAHQSSTIQEDGLAMNATLSTDGVLDGPCASTMRESNPFWTVDLLQTQSIYAVELLLANDRSPKIVDLQTLEIRVGFDETTGSNNQLCFMHHGPLESEQLHTFVCSRRITGRYVTVSSRNIALQLCEAFVLSTSAPSTWQCGTLPNMHSWGVLDQTCYHGSREALPWFSANTHCRMSGSALVSHTTDATQQFLASQLHQRASLESQFYWLGLVSGPGSSNWRWVQGDPLSLTSSFWASDDAMRITEPGQRTAYAAALSRTYDWKWVPALQALWYHWVCESKPLFCSSPGVPAGGGVMLSSQTYGIGTSAYYYCNFGYILDGLESRSCLDNGTWSGSIPNCLAVDCGSLTPPRGGHVSMVNSSTAFKAIAQYHCQLGFGLKGGHAVRVCDGNGEWTGRMPVCAEIDCGFPHAISNGSVKLALNSTRMGAVAEYSCMSGFSLVGSAVRHCAESQQWTPEPPSCYDADSVQKRLEDVEIANPRPAKQSNLMTGFIVAVVVLLVVIFVILFYLWKKKKLYDTFSHTSTLYAAGLSGSGSGSGSSQGNSKDVLYAYANSVAVMDSSSPEFYSTPQNSYGVPPVGYVDCGPGARAPSIGSSVENKERRGSAISSNDVYFVSSNSGVAEEAHHHMEANQGQGLSIIPTEFEIPPELLRLHKLPNGNIHLTLPPLRPGRQQSFSRPGLPNFHSGTMRIPTHNKRPSLGIYHASSSSDNNSNCDKIKDICNGIPLPALPAARKRRMNKAERAKKFHTMVGFVRKKWSETASTMRTESLASPKRPTILSPSALKSFAESRQQRSRPVISSPRPLHSSCSDSDVHGSHQVRSSSPTPTEILFSFDDDDSDFESEMDPMPTSDWAPPPPTTKPPPPPIPSRPTKLRHEKERRERTIEEECHDVESIDDDNPAFSNEESYEYEHPPQQMHDICINNSDYGTQQQFLKTRIHIHSDDVNIYEEVPTDMLPHNVDYRKNSVIQLEGSGIEMVHTYC